MYVVIRYCVQVDIIFHYLDNYFYFYILSYFNIAKVLVATGRRRNQTNIQKQANAEVIEIIDLIDPKYKHEFVDERTARYISVGGLLQNQLMICGGWDAISSGHFQDCIFLGQSITNLQMLEERIEAASVVLNQKMLWITGGYLKNSSEFISLDQQSAVQGTVL